MRIGVAIGSYKNKYLSGDFALNYWRQWQDKDFEL